MITIIFGAVAISTLCLQIALVSRNPRQTLNVLMRLLSCLAAAVVLVYLVVSAYRELGALR